MDVAIYLRDGKVELHQKIELGFDGMGSMWVDHEDGSQTFYNEDFVWKHTTSENFSVQQLAKWAFALAGIEEDMG